MSLLGNFVGLSHDVVNSHETYSVILKNLNSVSFKLNT